jgi:protein ImuB
MRILSLSLPRLLLELGGEGAGASTAPPGAIVRSPEASPLTPRDLQGHTRLDEVSEHAASYGVRAGQTLARAKAQYAALEVCIVHEKTIRETLERLAEGLLSFGATVAYSVEHKVVWADVTGCAHLFGGELNLARRAVSRIEECGHEAHAAIADGPRLAAMFAQVAGLRGSGPFVSRAPAEDMRDLPIECLPLPEPAFFRKLGITTVGEFRKLPKSSLGQRLGAKGADILALAAGVDRTPLLAHVPCELPVETVEFEDGVESTEALGFVLRPLCERLMVRVAGRGMALSELLLVVGKEEVPLTFPLPLTRATEVLSVLKSKLERLALGEPARLVALRTVRLSRKLERNASLFAQNDRAKLPRILSELCLELGEERVGKLAVGNSWVLHDRSRLVPFTEASPVRDDGYPMEPTRIVPPERLDGSKSGGETKILRHVVRTEHVEWWKPLALRTRVDLAVAWVSGTLALVEKNNHGLWLVGYLD